MDRRQFVAGSLLGAIGQAHGAGNSTQRWMQTALDSWEMICRERLKVTPEPLPWVIFFDRVQAFHLNPESNLLPPNRYTGARLKFGARSHRLLEVANSPRLWVPGRPALEIQPNCSTMPYAGGAKTFFILPLPSLYRTLAPASQAPELDRLFLGTAMHEMAHTRQLTGALHQIDNLRSRYRMPESLDDNIVETTFRNNAAYKEMYAEEKRQISLAILASDDTACRDALQKALATGRQRRLQFFVNEYAFLDELEGVFLALEGLGMWVQYQLELKLAPKGRPWLETLVKLSARSDAWSQEHGLGLFLLIDRLVPGWQARFVRPDFPSPIKVLDELSRHP